MLLQYFGFREEPFGATPDARCLYPSRTHREALASLQCGFYSNRGFTALIAPPGMGKTTLLFCFLKDVRESARSVFLFDIDAECGPREFVGYILRDIGITPGKSSSEMHKQLSDALVNETRAGRKFVVVIDEAQNLSDAVLERVRLLANFETSRGKMMQIVLSGQTQLADKLTKDSLVQLRQRISTICRIDPLSMEDTVAYIAFRLKQAGYKGEPLFTEDALRIIAETSYGTPRTINNLCFNALSVCRALKSKQVDGSMVAEVIADLQLLPQPKNVIFAVGNLETEKPREPEDRRPASPLRRLWAPSAAVLLVMCVLGGLGLAKNMAPLSHIADDSRSLNLRVRPASASTSVPEDAGKTIVTEPAPNTVPFEITVEPHQRLQDISMKYLGGWDLQRLDEIQALNPRLTDPDHIEAGQRIWLPGPSPVPGATNVVPQARERKLP